MNILRRVLLLCIITCASSSILPAQFTSLGKEFYFSGVQNAPNQFMLVSKYAATVDFHFTADPSHDFSVTLIPNEPYVVNMTLATSAVFASIVENAVDNKSLRITSSHPINITHFIPYGAADDGTVLYPVQQELISESVSDTFYLLSPGRDLNPLTTSSSIITAHYDCVKIEVIMNRPFHGIPAGTPFYVTLNKGETFLLRASASKRDYTGSRVRVVSSKKNNAISIYTSEIVYIYYPWYEMPTYSFCCADYVIAPILPSHTYSRIHHVIPPLELAIGMDYVDSVPAIVRLVSAHNDNNIYINNILVSTLHAGEVIDTALYYNSIIRSDKNVLIHQFHPSSSVYYSNKYGDPDQLAVVPIKSGVKESIFKIFPDYNSGSYDMYSPVFFILNLITTSDNDMITLNGVNITPLFHPFDADDDYKYVQIMLDRDATHHLLSKKETSAYIATLYNANGGSTYSLSDLSREIDFSEADTMLTPLVDSVKFCDEAVLEGRSGTDSFLWSSGSHNRAVTFFSEGVVWVTSYYVCDSITDTFYLRKMDAWIIPVNDTVICEGDSILIDVYNPDAASYLWSTGATGSSVYIKDQGEYSVTVSFEDNICPQVTERFRVSYYEIPVVKFEERIYLCDTIESVEIGSYQEGMDYIWNTGATSCCITVTESGYYELTATNFCEVVVKEGIWVNFIGCGDDCYTIPNVFSPNGDGLNDEFRVLTKCIFNTFELRIFNRFGEEVFRASDVNQSWDGTFRGKECDAGVYYYIVQGELQYGDPQMTVIKGDVMILR